MFVVYIAAVVYFTFFTGSRTNTNGFNFRLPLSFYRSIFINHRYGKTTNRSVLNLIMFIPFGYLTPKVFSMPSEKMLRLFLKVTIGGLLASLLIETLQLVLRRGIFELDDLVKNTMGAAIGCMIFCLLNRSMNQRTKRIK